MGIGETMPIEIRFEEGKKAEEHKPRVRVPLLPYQVKETYENCVARCSNPWLTHAEIKDYCAIYSWRKITWIIPTNHHLKLLERKLTKQRREHLENLGYIRCDTRRGIIHCEPLKPADEVCRWR